MSGIKIRRHDITANDHFKQACGSEALICTRRDTERLEDEQMSVCDLYWVLQDWLHGRNRGKEVMPTCFTRGSAPARFARQPHRGAHILPFLPTPSF